MKFTVYRTSKTENEVIREINSLDDLKTLQEEYKREYEESDDPDDYRWADERLIIDFESMEIEIYDYFRE
jgi:hypothetical protein